MYWSYQTTIKRGQNALRVVNVICGANTAFRADVFKQLIDEDAPYAIDDMYWLAEIVRQRLGRVAFVHDARSWTIDPHRLGDWYRQTVRWSWGQFQSVRGHRLGVPIQRDDRRRIGWGLSWFDVAYLATSDRLVRVRARAARVVPRRLVARAVGSIRVWLAHLLPRHEHRAGSSVAACALRKPRLAGARTRAPRPRPALPRDDAARRHQDDLSGRESRSASGIHPSGSSSRRRQSLLERKCPVKALITGGAGFIGSHLTELLLRTATRSSCSTTSPPARARTSRTCDGTIRFHLVVDSVLHPAVVNELVNKADVVYHLAAAVGVKTIVEQPVQDAPGQPRTAPRPCSTPAASSTSRCSSRRPPRCTATIGRGRSPRRRRRIYGATTQKRWAYADSKAMDEFLALAYHEEHDLDAVIVRLFNTVGPRQTGMYGMVVPRFVERALAREPIEIYGDGEQTRCFCHVHDTIRALRDLMIDLNRTSGEIFNVGANNQTTIARSGRDDQALTASDSPTVHIPFTEVYGTGIEDMLHRVPVHRQGAGHDRLGADAHARRHLRRRDRASRRAASCEWPHETQCRPTCRWSRVLPDRRGTGSCGNSGLDREPDRRRALAAGRRPGSRDGVCGQSASTPSGSTSTDSRTASRTRFP